MDRNSLFGIGAGIIAGALVVTPFGFAAPFPLFMAGLGLGWPAAALGAASGTVLLGMIGGASSALLYLFTHGAVPVIIARQALLSRQVANGTEWYPAGHLAAWLSGYAALAILIAAMVFFQDALTILKETEAYYIAFLESWMKAPADPIMRDEISTFVGWSFGAMAGGWMIMMIVNGTLAQGVLVRMGRNRRPSPKLADFNLPIWLLGGLAAALLAMWLWRDGAAFGRAWLIVFALPFAIRGLATVHTLSRPWSARTLILAAFYTLLVFLFPWSVAALAGLGVVEQLIQYQRRPPGADKGQEEE